LSENPNAIHLLKQHPEKIDWYNLGYNENAYKLLISYNYDLMKDNMTLFSEELIAYVFHPNRIINIAFLYNIKMNDYLNLI